MIVRVLTARVRPGRASHFNALIREQQASVRGQPGLVYIKLARRLEADGSEEVILFEEWRDPQSLYAWAGSDLARPRLPPGWEAEVFGVQVTHFEALDLGPEGLPPGIPLPSVTTMPAKVAGEEDRPAEVAGGDERPPTGTSAGVA